MTGRDPRVRVTREALADRHAIAGGALVILWGAAAGACLPRQVAAMYPRALPADDPVRYAAYAVGAAIPAAVAAAMLAHRMLPGGSTWQHWLYDWLMVGICAGAAAIAGGATVFGIDAVLTLLPTSGPFPLPNWLVVPLGFVTMWALAIMSGLGLGVLEGAFLALGSSPVAWLVWRWACRTSWQWPW